MRVSSLLLAFALICCLIFGASQPVQSLIPYIESAEYPSGWSDDIRLTNNLTSDDNQDIAVNGDNIFVVWSSLWLGRQIYYSNSSDGGASWAPRSMISQNGFNCNNPEIEIGDDNIHIIWDDNDAVDHEIKYRNSTDGGISWNSIKMISEDDNSWSGGAEIAINNSNIHVVWTDERFGGILNTETYYKRSIDGGITWDDALGNASQDRRLTFGATGIGPFDIKVNDSNVHVLLGSDREGNPNLYYIQSKDNGVTWEDGLGNISQEQKLTTNSTDHFSGAMDVEGSNIHVVWVDEAPGPKYYLYYRNSTDNGASWNTIQLLAGDANGPNKPDITVDGNDIHIVWDAAYDDRDIYYMNSTDNGGSWSVPLRISVGDTFHSFWPLIETNGSKRHIVWWDERDGNREVYYKRYPDFPPQPAEINLTLQYGWNLISFPVEEPKLNGTPIYKASDIFNVTNCTELAKWNTTVQNYTIYIPGFNVPTDPENFEIGEDDAIFVWWNESYNMTFNITGYEPGNQNVTLKTGWNMVAYKGLAVQDVTLWTNQISCGLYDDVCYYEDGVFKHYIFPGTVMGLVPTRGYFVWSDTDTWLEY